MLKDIFFDNFLHRLFKLNDKTKQHPAFQNWAKDCSPYTNCGQAPLYCIYYTVVSTPLQL